MKKLLLIATATISITACTTNKIDTSSVININRNINKVKYVSDIDNYGINNYKATPDEFYKNGGDCEDYAIAKYEALRAAGIPDRNIKFISARTLKFVDHVMLEVDINFKRYILDIYSDKLEDINYLDENYRNIVFFNKKEMDKLWNNEGNK